MESKIKKDLKKIVIGNTGYIGSFLLNELAKKEVSILGISRNKTNLKYKLKNKNLLQVDFDIFKERILDKLNFESRSIIYICAHNVHANFSCKRQSLEFIYNSNKNSAIV